MVVVALAIILAVLFATPGVVTGAEGYFRGCPRRVQYSPGTIFLAKQNSTGIMCVEYEVEQTHLAFPAGVVLLGVHHIYNITYYSNGVEYHNGTEIGTSVDQTSYVFATATPSSYVGVPFTLVYVIYSVNVQSSAREGVYWVAPYLCSGITLAVGITGENASNFFHGFFHFPCPPFMGVAFRILGVSSSFLAYTN